MTSPNYLAAMDLGWIYFREVVVGGFISKGVKPELQSTVQAAADQAFKYLPSEYVEHPELIVDPDILAEIFLEIHADQFGEFRKALDAASRKLPKPAMQTDAEKFMGTKPLFNTFNFKIQVENWFGARNPDELPYGSVVELIKHAPAGLILSTNVAAPALEVKSQANSDPASLIFDAFYEFKVWCQNAIGEISGETRSGNRSHTDIVGLIAQIFPELDGVVGNSITPPPQSRHQENRNPGIIRR